MERRIPRVEKYRVNAKINSRGKKIHDVVNVACFCINELR